MIFELEFPERKEFVQAKSLKKMQIEYAKEFGEEEFLKVKKVIIIEPEVAKGIFLISNEPELIDKISLYDAACGNDFAIIGSTDWD